MNHPLRRLGLGGILATTFVSRMPAQSVQVASTPPGPGLLIVVTWLPRAGLTRYNVYRKLTSAASFPSTPINASPITAYTDCVAIQAFVHPDAQAWKALVDLPDFCSGSVPPDAAMEAELQLLGNVHWRIAVVAGQGYVDKAVAAGTSYMYD